MSWDASPDRTHHDVIASLLREYKPKELQRKTNELVSSEYDVKKGFLRCRAVIQDGLVLAILKSDPCDWSPSKGLLNDLKAKHRERTKVELWENDSGAVTVIGCISTAEPMLRKIAEISPATKQRHSAQ
ncbi:uncharacterized protein LOC110240706, partial [Exaiptasia diaphana]|uniref:Uncharacterized protein n=1 Tax=Exaiptasia diaphana TaxID=2652724 RepID=A0A913XC38_EXADI